MQKLIDAFDAATAPLLAITSAVIWFLRLESRWKVAETMIEQLKQQRMDDLRTFAAQRDADQEHAAEARKEQMDLMREIRGDLKSLMLRLGEKS